MRSRRSRRSSNDREERPNEPGESEKGVGVVKCWGGEYEGQ
jgi:hypothetical protein